MLVLDNANVHDHARIYALAQKFGVIVLFLPTYSYDFNPVEYIFHLSKNQLARNGLLGVDHNSPLADDFKEALITCCTPDQACNLFQHCFIEVTPAHRQYANT